MSIVYRPMTEADIEAVVQIEKATLGSAWTPAAYRSELENLAAIYRVAEDDGRIVGYGGLWLVLDEIHVTALAVIPEAQGRGIGERLFCTLLLTALERGARTATLEVRPGNVAAQGLYAKYGFVWAAQRKNYYPDTGENADLLWIHDMSAPEWRARFDSNRAALGL